MDVNSRRVQITRWLLFAALIVLALWLLNLTAYHAFASDFPASPNREWHARWAGRFVIASAISFIAAAVSLFLLRRRKLAA